jgi:hypothetical protein
MKIYALMFTAALASLCGVAFAQLPPHALHSISNPNAAGDCYAINSFVPSVGVVAGDSGTPCAPAFRTSAYTNATTSFTPILALPPVQGATTLRGECTLTYSDSSTSGTATFGIGLSAAPTDLWVTSTPTTGVFVVPTYTTITTTTTTAVTGALVTTAANANYQVYLSFSMVNATAANTLTVYASTNGTGVLTVQSGSSCSWIP